MILGRHNGWPVQLSLGQNNQCQKTKQRALLGPTTAKTFWSGSLMIKEVREDHTTKNECPPNYKSLDKKKVDRLLDEVARVMEATQKKKKKKVMVTKNGEQRRNLADDFLQEGA